MAHFEAGPAPAAEQESAAVSARNSVLGLRLFSLYVAIYAAYMLLNAFQPDLMAREFLLGLNVAVVYGFGLILSAFLLSLLYGWLCRTSRSG